MTDVIVVSGGLNGLVCAAYLLRGAKSRLPGRLASAEILRSTKTRSRA